MSNWNQANWGGKHGLLWRNRNKISQIINDYLCLSFFLLIILWLVSWEWHSPERMRFFKYEYMYFRSLTKLATILIAGCDFSLPWNCMKWWIKLFRNIVKLWFCILPTSRNCPNREQQSPGLSFLFRRLPLSSSLTSLQVSSCSLTSPQVASCSRTSPQLFSCSLTSPQVFSCSLTSLKVASFALTSSHIASYCLASPQVARCSLTSPHIDK
jgi:hypothetical protein